MSPSIHATPQTVREEERELSITRQADEEISELRQMMKSLILHSHAQQDTVTRIGDKVD